MNNIYNLISNHPVPVVWGLITLIIFIVSYLIINYNKTQRNNDKTPIPFLSSIIAWVALIFSLLNFIICLLIWNSFKRETNIDTLSISITALEVILGVIAVLLALGAYIGFWMIRRDALEAARIEASEAVRIEIANHIEKIKQT